MPYHFTIEDRTGKARCKREIQRLFGLNQESEWPLLASVARLVEQKGIELIREILPQLMDMGVQLIVFGQGDPKYIEYFTWAKEQWPVSSASPAITTSRRPAQSLRARICI